MKNIFRFIGFLCLVVASIFSLINTIVENKIFDAYVIYFLSYILLNI